MMMSNGGGGDGIKSEIMERGYWEVELRPESYPQKLLSFEQLRYVLQACQVRYRGWYYPHVSAENMHGKYYNADNYVQSWVRHAYFLEIFRLYTSGQFVHYAGMHEDRRGNKNDGVAPLVQQDTKHECEQRFLNPVGSLYRLAEIFLFASRLAKKEIFGDRAHIIIKLHKQKDRILKSEDLEQIHGWDGMSHTDVIELMNSDVDAQRLYLDYDKMTVDAMMRLLEFFNFHSKDIRTLLESEQKRLYDRAF